MTPRTNGNPKNATPVKLQLKPPVFPRLPFSSPIGEEILSPTSPKSRTPPQDRLRGTVPSHRSEEAITKSRGLALDNVVQDRREKRKEESPGRPGLNIVTSFPPRISSAQKRPIDGRRKEGGTSQSKISNPSPNPSPSGHVRQTSSRSLKSAGSRSRLDALRRADSKVSNLSPGDRAVVIGIDLPPEELAQHAQSGAQSAVSLGQEGERGIGSHLEAGKQHAKNPSIVVTPAGSIPPWSANDDEKTFLSRPRARSSVYSQGPELANINDSSTVPPVPALPPEVKNNRSGIKATSDGNTRIMSTCTMFDEEADPIIRGQPDSERSPLRILRYASTDTLTTRPRSQGWWNNVMSPFWPKSPMHFKMPSYPNSPTLSFRGYGRNPSMKDGDDSLIDEKAGSIKSGHTSWTDSPVPEEAEKPALTFDQILPSHDHSRSISALHPGDSRLVFPVAPTQLDNLGAAVEYYEACYHDQYETTPFFECQNHQCLPREFEANGIHVDDLGHPQSRGLGLEGADTQGPSRGVETEDAKITQVPTNRFSAAFRGVSTPKRNERVTSEATFIDDLDETPDVHNAHVAPIVKAPEPISMPEPPPAVKEDTSTMDPPRSRDIHRSLPPPPAEAIREEPIRAYRTPPQPPPPPMSSPPVNAPLPEERPVKRAVAIMPPPPEPVQPKFEQPRSPPPPTPGPLTPRPGGALPLRELQADPDASRPAGNTYIVNHHYHQPRSGEQTSMADFFPPPRFKPYPTQAEADEAERKEKMEQARRLKEKKKEYKKEEVVVKEAKPSMLSKLKSCGGGRKKPKKGDDGKMTKKKKRLLWLLGASLVALILLIVLLAMFLHRRGDNMPVQTQWLNITGYPPIPTGVSTIIQPKAVNEVSGCVDVPTMWSCALPKEQQKTFSSGAPDQPNFRVEIRFENGTNATSSINSTSNSKRSENVVNAVTAAGFIRHRLHQLRRSLPSSLFTPSPSAPSQEDQTFLGNTTDGNQAPFDGEYTPFFMTFDSPAPLPSRLAKRDSPTSTSSTTPPSTTANTTDPFPNLTSAIPPAATEPNGTASPATLYPLPSAQPLRLYNRGTPTEHYGFYTYFDRSIFLKSTLALNASSSSLPSIPSDLNGGSPADAAKVRCTWTQTRFLVQIWTNKPSAHFHPSFPSNTTSTPPKTTPSTLASTTANTLTPPGSFPYPITLTLDRHGGNVRTKEIYCYALSDNETPESGPGDKKLQLEDRGFRGTLVNPASGPFATNVVGSGEGGEGGMGGIDGGSGGCGCGWQNWG